MSAQPDDGLAAAAGAFMLGGARAVHRLGYGVMQLPTAPGAAGSERQTA